MSAYSQLQVHGILTEITVTHGGCVSMQEHAVCTIFAACFSRLDQSFERGSAALLDDFVDMTVEVCVVIARLCFPGTVVVQAGRG